MRYLMCKNTKVLNLDTYDILASNLLPGYVKKNHPSKETYHVWMKSRYSSSSNTLARKLQGIQFGQGNRSRINRLTHALSFTDCYWEKDETETILFQDISPYYTRFWDGLSEFNGESAPTLYTDGCLPKKWLQSGELFKQGDLSLEIECINLCKACGIPVEDGYTTPNGICVTNFTSDMIMFENAKASGEFDEYDFTDEDIVSKFGKSGVQMLVIDAIIGNGDRHAGNFGYLRNTDSGAYIGMAPLYDFDHALDSTATNKPDILISDMLQACKAYTDEISRICNISLKCDNNIFHKRAQLILDLI